MVSRSRAHNLYGTQCWCNQGDICSATHATADRVGKTLDSSVMVIVPDVLYGCSFIIETCLDF